MTIQKIHTIAVSFNFRDKETLFDIVENKPAIFLLKSGAIEGSSAINGLLDDLFLSLIDGTTIPISSVIGWAYKDEGKLFYRPQNNMEYMGSKAKISSTNKSNEVDSKEHLPLFPASIVNVDSSPLRAPLDRGEVVRNTREVTSP